MNTEIPCIVLDARQIKILNIMIYHRLPYKLCLGASLYRTNRTLVFKLLVLIILDYPLLKLGL